MPTRCGPPGGRGKWARRRYYAFLTERLVLNSATMSDVMFNEAVQALRAGQRMRARDLLTRLLKADQSNVDYWLWMSAAVDAEKEQVFCLQNALKLDPNSTAARRGLVVLGALSPEHANLPP